MTGPLIDPEGRCERCGRLVPIECPEPDGLSCGTYVLSPAHASLGTDGRITTVYPSGESYTDSTPRLGPAAELARLMGPLPPLVAMQVAVDLREARYDKAIWTAGQHGVDLRPALGFHTTEPLGARGCVADDQGPEDPAF